MLAAISAVVRTFAEGGIEMNPPYQRGDVWTVEQRRNLIRSLLLGVPIAALVLNRRGSNQAWQDNEGDPGETWYAVVDGKQRLTTMVMWFDSKLFVPADWFAPESLPEGMALGAEVTYGGLTIRGQRFVGQAFNVPVAEARLGSLSEEAEVYGLINQAGTAQSAADLDRARAIASS